MANRPSKIVATRGKTKKIGSLSTAERGQLVTVEICMNAVVFFAPPLFVFPRKRMKDELIYNSPPGSIDVPHESGWMQSDILVSWFEHFLKHANPSADRSVILPREGGASRRPFLSSRRPLARLRLRQPDAPRQPEAPPRQPEALRRKP